MSESNPTVKWPKNPVITSSKNVKLRNVKISKKRPKAVVVINFVCPDCKKRVTLTMDKKTCKEMLVDIKAGGHMIPPGTLVAPVIPARFSPHRKEAHKH